MENKMETGLFAELFYNGILAFLQDFRTQLDVAGFINAVDVAKGRGQQVATANRIQFGRDREGILRGGVELGVVITHDTVLFATYRTGLDLQDQIIPGEPLQQSCRN